MPDTMPPMDALDERIIAIVASELKRDPGTLRPEATLKESGISSLEFIEILFALEDHLGVTFEANQQDIALETLRDLLDEVRRMLAKAQDSSA